MSFITTAESTGLSYSQAAQILSCEVDLLTSQANKLKTENQRLKEEVESLTSTLAGERCYISRLKGNISDMLHRLGEDRPLMNR
jgi:DNA gyrase/topoisomerase IV subunit A